MNIIQLRETTHNLKKFFVDMEGNIYIADDLHERLAREICEKNNWTWIGRPNIYSAEDFLMHEKGFVKFANYEHWKYIAMSKNFFRDKEVSDNAYFLADLFNLKIEVY